ncbi:transposase [Aliikangiella coralliicola]|uniref:Transposase n=1 Tax=Aliikangiella coralliicola TaxID=2592383 RepID=A0A545UA48_9GAMM|nr:transposase [Aliikangiella coralliicola]TQV86341.1 hypothetical protein FLL46_15570 [Aliikangiella coralliicola]
MPRAERLEYEDAYYHVMNRGMDRGRVKIFRSGEYFKAFLATLEEAAKRFGIVVHAYCLMTNHYHLLIQTPRANLSRAMRHVNGVYTQRHNRLAKSDGAIFRGRFKSILIDNDAYLLQLSRYIHRNPIETKKTMVEALVNYPWSSYPAYVNQAESPEWLERDQTYGMLGAKQRYSGYAKYVAQGNSEELTRFYSRGNIASVIGEKEFVEWLKAEKIPEVKQKDWVNKIVPHGLSIQQITRNTANYYQLPLGLLRQLKKGRHSQLRERKVAIYLCQYLGDHTLKEIGEYFGLGHIGSVSHITSTMRREIGFDINLSKEIEQLCQFIINNVT